ncbi:MAG: hypothetical protein MUE33_01270 [Cytophagaceae bacterium]|jgi:hypothetical protein|nr:hypothetical protein [Cytophagaceae bacterium]
MKNFIKSILTVIVTGLIFLYQNVRVQGQTPIGGGTVNVGTTTLSNGVMSSNGTSLGTNVLNFGPGLGILSPRSVGTLPNFNGLDFFTSNIARMRITSSGNVGIGLASTVVPTDRFHVVGTSRFEGNMNVIGTNTITGTNIFRGTNGVIATFQSSTQVSANTFALFQIGTSTTYGPEVFLTAHSGLPSTSLPGVGIAKLSIQKNGGFTSFGSFEGPGAQVQTGHYFPGSLVHVNNGNLQISSSGAPSNGTEKVGLILGHNGALNLTNNNQYSWIQSVRGPLVLNPLAGNTNNGTTNDYNYVAIGYTPAPGQTNIPTDLRLIVKGKILCEELKVKLQSGWYDHVLQPGYNLITLDSLQNFITTNSHLPDIPSAAQVEEEGIEAGAMSGLLLKKIEELTLYMIEQNNKIGNQENQIELLKKQNEILMQQLALMQEQYKQIQSIQK